MRAAGAPSYRLTMPSLRYTPALAPREDHREYKSTLVWHDVPLGAFRATPSHGEFRRVYYYRIWYRTTDGELIPSDWMRCPDLK